jgi:hypothetical protein
VTSMRCSRRSTQTSFRADSAAMPSGASREVRGAPAVAKQFSGRARLAQPALVNGAVGIVVAPLGRLLMVLSVTFTRGKIAEIDVIAIRGGSGGDPGGDRRRHRPAHDAQRRQVVRVRWCGRVERPPLGPPPDCSSAAVVGDTGDAGGVPTM